jgi:hypothetical protein
MASFNGVIWLFFFRLMMIGK